MKKTFILLAILSIFFSCKTDKKKDGEKVNVTPVEEVDETPIEETEIDDSLELPEGIASYLESKMPGHELVSKEEWLAEDYLEGMAKSIRPRYNEDILALGDFNGDGEEDFATFLKDKNGQVSLYAFHKVGNGYKKYLLQKEGKPDFLGAGLSVEEPGFVYGGNKEVGLEYNGINYDIYEKTTTTFYYNAGRYRKLLTTD